MKLIFKIRFSCVNITPEHITNNHNLTYTKKKPIISDRLQIVPRNGIEPLLALRRTGF
jgi:hypothetical protein